MTFKNHKNTGEVRTQENLSKTLILMQIKQIN